MERDAYLGAYLSELNAVSHGWALDSAVQAASAAYLDDPAGCPREAARAEAQEAE